MVITVEWHEKGKRGSKVERAVNADYFGAAFEARVRIMS